MNNWAVRVISEERYIGNFLLSLVNIPGMPMTSFYTDI